MSLQNFGLGWPNTGICGPHCLETSIIETNILIFWLILQDDKTLCIRLKIGPIAPHVWCQRDLPFAAATGSPMQGQDQMTPM
jgi:hypothetical protein